MKINQKEIRNYLIVTIVLGIITVLTYKPKEDIKKQKLRRIDNYFIYLLGIVGAFLVYFKIKDLGWISYLISIISGILIITLNKLIVKEEDEDKPEGD